MPHFWLSFLLLFCFCSPFCISSSFSLSSSMASPSNKNTTNISDMPPPTPPAPLPTFGRINLCPPEATYIHTNPENFKATVQRFTGMRSRTLHTTIAAPAPFLPPRRLSSIGLGPRIPAPFKIFERRPFPQNALNELETLLRGGGISGEKFMASPVSPFQLLGIGSPTNSTPTPSSTNSAPAPPAPLVVDEEEELRQIRENGFYLYPRPRRGSKRPRLLRLFPLRPGSQSVEDDGVGVDEEDADDSSISSSS